MTTIRSAGFDWTYDGDGWNTDITDRITATTWKFGSIHQCKVFINDVGICLEPRKTRSAAMKHCVEWAQSYIKDGPPSVEQMFADCYTHWADLYETRKDVIHALFFLGGSGYKWLDGAIISTSPEDHLSFKRCREKDKSNPLKIKVQKLFREVLDSPSITDELKAILQDALGEESENNKMRPQPDNDEQCYFYPVSEEYANITNVPDDVKPDWLQLSCEAAKLLRDRSKWDDIDNERYAESLKNIVIGGRVVYELEERFPNLLNKE